MNSTIARALGAHLPGPLAASLIESTALPDGYAVTRLPDPAHRPALTDGMMRTAAFSVTGPGFKSPYLIDLYTRSDAHAPSGWEATKENTTNESGYYSSGSLGWDYENETGKLTLSDFDGVPFLPRCVCAVLRALGFNVADDNLSKPL